MKVTCCTCGKTYDFEANVYQVIQLPDNNCLERLKCPYCGLEHQVIWVKVPKR